MNIQLGSLFENHIKSAKDLCNQKNYDQAIEFCDEALQYDNGFEAYRIKAKCLYALGRSDDCLDTCYVALNLNVNKHKLSIIYNTIGAVKDALYEHADAIDYFTLALENAPKVLHIKMNLAISHIKNGDLAKGRALAEEITSNYDLTQSNSLLAKLDIVKQLCECHQVETKEEVFSLGDFSNSLPLDGQESIC